MPLQQNSRASQIRIVITILSAILLVLTVSGDLENVSPTVASNTLATTTGPGSWNPSVSCTPIAVTVEQILGNQTNSMGGASLNGSMFNPGITSPIGLAKRWLTPGPTPLGWVSPGPPCVTTNANGQVVSAFVEIHHVQRSYLTNEDYAVNFDPVNGGGPYPNGMNISDTTFNAFTPGYANCTSANTTGCMHTIHVEFDHDWKAAGYCGLGTACDPHLMAGLTPAEPSSNRQKSPPPSACFIDLQGFVYWDSKADGGDYASHSFSGREIHPLTAWRISPTTPDYSISANPIALSPMPGQSASSTIIVKSINSFTGTVTLATSVAAISNSSVATPVAALSPASLALSANGTATSDLTISDASSDTGDYIVTVSATGGNLTRSTILGINVVDFSVAANPNSLTIPMGSSGQSTLTLISINGFTGSITLTTQVSPTSVTAGLSPLSPSTSLSATSVALSNGGSGILTLTVSASLLTTPGTYAVTVTATIGGLTHTTVVDITVAVF